MVKRFCKSYNFSSFIFPQLFNIFSPSPSYLEWEVPPPGRSQDSGPTCPDRPRVGRSCQWEWSTTACHHQRPPACSPCASCPCGWREGHRAIHCWPLPLWCSLGKDLWTLQWLYLILNIERSVGKKLLLCNNKSIKVLEGKKNMTKCLDRFFKRLSIPLVFISNDSAQIILPNITITITVAHKQNNYN